MKTKILVIAILPFLAIPGIAEVIDEVVSIKLGAKAFRDGDVIQIIEVRSTYCQALM